MGDMGHILNKIQIFEIIALIKFKILSPRSAVFYTMKIIMVCIVMAPDFRWTRSWILKVYLYRFTFAHVVSLGVLTVKPSSVIFKQTHAITQVRSRWISPAQSASAESHVRIYLTFIKRKHQAAIAYIIIAMAGATCKWDDEFFLCVTLLWTTWFCVSKANAVSMV